MRRRVGVSGVYVALLRRVRAMPADATPARARSALVLTTSALSTRTVLMHFCVKGSVGAGAAGEGGVRACSRVEISAGGRGACEPARARARCARLARAPSGCTHRPFSSAFVGKAGGEMCACTRVAKSCEVVSGRRRWRPVPVAPPHWHWRPSRGRGDDEVEQEGADVCAADVQRRQAQVAVVPLRQVGWRRGERRRRGRHPALAAPALPAHPAIRAGGRGGQGGGGEGAGARRRGPRGQQVQDLG
jgi:hypothetical protein